MTMLPNFERMIRLADEFFDMKNDPDQLAVNQEVIDRLRAIHPFTLNEASNEEGPVAWILVIPTTNEVMKSFVGGAIGEKELLALTMPGQAFEAIYLCSALVLPEHRLKGHALRLSVQSVNEIRKDHRVTSLYVWPFSNDGEELAGKVAAACKLPLVVRSQE